MAKYRKFLQRDIERSLTACWIRSIEMLLLLALGAIVTAAGRGLPDPAHVTRQAAEKLAASAQRAVEAPS